MKYLTLQSRLTILSYNTVCYNCVSILMNYGFKEEVKSVTTGFSQGKSFKHPENTYYGELQVTMKKLLYWRYNVDIVSDLGPLCRVFLALI